MTQRLSATDRDVLRVLRASAGAAGETRLAAPAIASAACISIRSVRYALHRLQVAGLLATESEPGRQGSVKRLLDPTLTAPHPRVGEGGNPILTLPANRAKLNAEKIEIVQNPGVNRAKPPEKSCKTRLARVLPLNTNTCTVGEVRKEPPQEESLSTTNFPQIPPPKKAPEPERHGLHQHALNGHSLPSYPGRITASAAGPRDLFGGRAEVRGVDLATKMVALWNAAQERKRAHWPAFIRRAKAPPPEHLAKRLLRAWQENNLNWSKWQEVCRRCVENTALAGFAQNWDGATLAWVVRPDRTHVADILAGQRWPADCKPERAPGGL